jgi:hypothetical protein
MRVGFKVSVLGVAIAAMLAGCASENDLRLLREPSLPPVAVAKAAPLGILYQNVRLQEVTGAPEFRWFDGGAVFDTRPTRVQVIKSLNRSLDRADMLAPSRIDADYMLYVHFDDLRGPDVWIGSDKLSSAKITFRLVNWRTGQVIKEESVEASYRAKWAGFTPDQVRAAIAGPIAVTKDFPIAPVGGLVGGLIVGYYVNENLVVNIASVPAAAYDSGVQANDIGGPIQGVKGGIASLATGFAISSARGHFTDFEAMLAGGAVSAVGAGYGPVVPTTATAEDDELGPLNGIVRRNAATAGLLNLAFDEFMTGLQKDGSVVYKRAVSCLSLNPYGTRMGYVQETEDAYAVDCPDSKFNDATTKRAFPNHF